MDDASLNQNGLEEEFTGSCLCGGESSTLSGAR